MRPSRHHRSGTNLHAYRLSDAGDFVVGYCRLAGYNDSYNEDVAQNCSHLGKDDCFRWI